MATVAEILMAQGRQAGNARRERGSAWAPVVQQIAGLPAQVMADRAAAGEQQRKQYLDTQTARVNEQRIERGNQEIAGDRRAQEEEQQLRRLFSSGEPPDPQAVISLIGPERGTKLLEGLSAMQKIPGARYEEQRQLIRKTLLGLQQVPEGMRAEGYPDLRMHLTQSGAVKPDEMPEQYDPAWFTAAVNYGQEAKPPKVDQVDPTKDLYIDGTLKRSGVQEVKPDTRDPQQQANDALRKGDTQEYSRIMRSIKDTAAAGRGPQQGPQPSYGWAKDPTTGESVYATPDEIRRGKLVQPDTSDMRNKSAAKPVAARAVKAVRDLGARIITKVGPAQRADAIKRGAEAVFGTDPEFRTYQDSRMALAGTLAVEQQGARVSDSDVKALWLPMVPDAYRDTKESNALKWDLIDAMRGVSNGAKDATDVKVDDPYEAYLKRQGGK